MIRILKEIFSSKNIKRAMLLSALSTSERITSEDFKYLVSVIRDEEYVDNKENIIEENQLKKAS